MKSFYTLFILTVTMTSFMFAQASFIGSEDQYVSIDKRLSSMTRPELQDRLRGLESRASLLVNEQENTQSPSKTKENEEELKLVRYETIQIKNILKGL